MSGFVDIHTHLLPGIDDGPRNLEGALKMARAAAGAGIETIAATPHLRSDFPDVHVHELADRCRALREAIEHQAIALELVCGAEVSLTWALEASADNLRLASFARRGTDLLIETPVAAVGGLGELLYEIRMRGYRLTLAHPERSELFQSNPAELAELVTQGVLLQVNAASLHPGRGSHPHRLAVRLCREGLAHAIASDAHRATSWRPVTELAVAFDSAVALVGLARAQWMTREAPAAILAGNGLPEPPGIETRSLVRRFFRRR